MTPPDPGFAAAPGVDAAPDETGPDETGPDETGPDETGLGDWREVAPGAYVLVAEPGAVNLGLVVGDRSALLVDTGSTPAQGQALRAAVARLTAVPVVAAVVTHGHDDHVSGLAAFGDLTTIGHEALAERPVSPNRPVVVATAVDLGGRRVEVVHLGRGHTDGDLVVVVPGADLVFAGDLVESAGPPAFGADCYPLEWADTLDGLIGLLNERTTVVPGHGDPVDRDFVFDARGRTAAVSAEVRRLAGSGVAEADALATGTWAYPAEHLADAVHVGYAQLGPQTPARRNLPLL